MDEEDSETLAGLAAEGIHAVAVPTPFGVGPVNAFLFEGDPPTLVDGGPNLATSLAFLDRTLRGVGVEVGDIGRIVVTHHHIDHAGLAGVLSERTGARVAFLGSARTLLEDHEGESAAEDGFAAGLMARHGVEDHVVDALKAFSGRLRGFGAPSPVHEPLTPGEEVAIAGRRFSVHHRPGHSHSDTVFAEVAAGAAGGASGAEVAAGGAGGAGGGVLIAGDHLLARISSNALVSRPDAVPGLPAPLHGRSRPLLAHRASLLATREQAARVVLTGHGPPVTDHRTLIDKRIEGQDRRASQILDALADGPLPAHGIAASIWGRVAVAQAYLTLSEVLGHLDLLLDDGSVEEDAGEPVTVFRAR